MSAPSVSVVIVSHGRPESLLWCLSALAGVAYQPFEIVVVADLAAWHQDRRAQTADGFPRHITRMWPKKEAEVRRSFIAQAFRIVRYTEIASGILCFLVSTHRCLYPTPFM